MAGILRTGLVFMSLFIAAIILFVFMPSPSHSEIHRWKDENGHWHFSDSLTREDTDPDISESEKPDWETDRTSTVRQTVKESPAKNKDVNEASGPDKQAPPSVPPATKVKAANKVPAAAGTNKAPSAPPVKAKDVKKASGPDKQVAPSVPPAAKSKAANGTPAGAAPRPSSVKNEDVKKASGPVKQVKPSEIPATKDKTTNEASAAVKAPNLPEKIEESSDAPVTANRGQSSPTRSEKALAQRDDLSSIDSVTGGMLWKVRKGKGRSSYLLGTIHSSDRRVVRLRPAVARALDRSERFVMEMIPDTSALRLFGITMVFNDGRSLQSVLDQDLYDQVVKAMADYGLPELAIRNMKPWVIMAMLSMPKPGNEPILDLVLHQEAVSAGKATAGLESAKEQLAVFEGLSLEDQVRLLEMTLAQLPEMPKMMAQLLQAYIDDDLKRIARIAAGYKNQGDDALMERFSHRLNDARNVRMVNRMASYLKMGNSFIAVGAMHLPGPTGLIELLRQEGYTVSPVQ